MVNAKKCKQLFAKCSGFAHFLKIFVIFTANISQENNNVKSKRAGKTQGKSRVYESGNEVMNRIAR